MELNDATLAAHQQELRRGTVVLAVLALLRQPGYGYALLEELAVAGIEVDANTLYPLLRRLEKQALLTSHWDTEGGRPRKYYRTSDYGTEILGELAREWERLGTRLGAILQQGGRGHKLPD